MPADTEEIRTLISSVSAGTIIAFAIDSISSAFQDLDILVALRKAWCFVFLSGEGSGSRHSSEFPGNYPVFTMVMVIYFTLIELDNSFYPQFFHIIYTIIKKYYPGEPVNIHIQ